MSTTGFCEVVFGWFLDRARNEESHAFTWVSLQVFWEWDFKHIHHFLDCFFWRNLEAGFSLVCLTQMLAQKFAWGLMWIQSPSIASFTRQNFQSNIDSKIGQGPSMDSTLGTASRHHDKILQCCYFNAKCCRRSLKKVREGVNIKKTSLNHQNYIQCSHFYNVML